METKKLLELLDKAYQDVQMLDLKPTKGNMAILMNVMVAMEQAYKYLQSVNPEQPEEPVPEIDGGKE